MLAARLEAKQSRYARQITSSPWHPGLAPVCEAYRHLYLVAMTGHGRTEDQRTAIAAGFDLHLMKPADPKQLQTLLASCRPK